MNLGTNTPTSLSTERLIIRRYQVSDEQALFDAARESIAEVFQFLPWCHPDYGREDASEWIKYCQTNWQAGTAYSFGIFGREDGVFHGGCGINRVDEHPTGNLGYWVKTPSTGRGIAAEAASAVARYGIRELGLQRIEVIMATENAASRRVAEAAGAVYEGIARRRLQLHGKAHDAFVYSITADDIC